MITINLSPNDRDDILELLDYALECKLKEPPEKIGRWEKWDNSGYWKLRVPQLKKLIKGSKLNETVYQSSFFMLEADIERCLDDNNN